MQAPSTSEASPCPSQPNNAIPPSLNLSRPGALPPTPSTSTNQPVGKVSQSHVIQGSPITYTYTDDVSAKPSSRVRRKCYTCHTTNTAAWRRSSVTPGKVLCNKCGLLERTRAIGSARRTGRVVRANQDKRHRDASLSSSHAGQADEAAGPAHQHKKQKQQHGVENDPETQATVPWAVAGGVNQHSPQQASRKITPGTMAAGAHAVLEGQASGSILSTSWEELGKVTDRVSD